MACALAQAGAKTGVAGSSRTDAPMAQTGARQCKPMRALVPG